MLDAQNKCHVEAPTLDFEMLQSELARDLLRLLLQTMLWRELVLDC
jgi:hypothetical protein